MDYKFVIVNDTIAVVFENEVFSGSIKDLSKEDLALITSGDATLDKVRAVFNPSLAKVIGKKIAIEQKIANLPSEFELVGGRVIVSGINVAVPEYFVDEFQITPTQERKQALLNFWSLACLNPDVEARDGLFRFVRESGFYITNKGYLVAYRNVKIKENGDRELFLAICNQYVRVKKWKKSPSNYHLVKYTDDTYSVILTDKVNADSNEYIVVGNLANLYDKKEEYQETVYTWAYGAKGSGLETDEIRIGVPFRMERELCDPNPHNSCSHGLHFTSWSNLSGYAVGSHTLAILVNPMHVVAVPYGYDGKKARCCEYLPVAEVKEEITSDQFDVFEQEYEEYTLDQVKDLMLESNLKDGKECLKIEEIPEIFKVVESTLEERRSLLEERYYDYIDEEEDNDDDEDYYDDNDSYGW